MMRGEALEIIDYLNWRTHGQWRRWATAQPWTWPKVEAVYCWLLGEEEDRS